MRSTLLAIAILLAGCSGQPPPTVEDGLPDSSGDAASPATTVLHDCLILGWRSESPVPVVQSGLPPGYQAAGTGSSTVAVEAMACQGKLVNGSYVGAGRAGLGRVQVKAGEDDHSERLDFYAPEIWVDSAAPVPGWPSLVRANLTMRADGFWAVFEDGNESGMQRYQQTVPGWFEPFAYRLHWPGGWFDFECHNWLFWNGLGLGSAGDAMQPFIPPNFGMAPVETVTTSCGQVTLTWGDVTAPSSVMA